MSRSTARTRRLRRWLTAAGLAGALAALALPGGASASPAPAPTTGDSVAPSVIRVLAPTKAQVRRLGERYDLLEARRGKDLFVLGDADVAAALRAEGFRVAAGRKLPALPRRSSAGASAAAAYPTFYGGYHTVVAHWQHLADTAAAHPDLATVVDYGDTWLRQQRRGGTDLFAICLTKKKAGDCALTPSAPKPRTVLFAAIHARELATAEIAWNWIDHLVAGYGTDPTVTSLMDTTEMWVIPVANPDGRLVVEQGGNSPYYQRKNFNDTRGACRRPPTSSNQYGVDLNRNATWAWGGVGSSTSACTQTYRGTGAASEPETAAQQRLWSQLFADRRGPNRSDAAPADTTGTFISYHSYAGLTLYPWGDVNTDAPNGPKLKALADRMAAYTGYTTGQGGEVLYATSGTTDDDLYGRLGVAAFTTELGAEGTNCDGFMPPYSCVANRFWPQERQALTALAQAAAGPYR